MLLIFILLSRADESYGTVAVKRTLAEMVNLADVAFEGTVVRIESRRINGWLRTFVTFGNLNVIKGEVENSFYILQLSGGEVDGLVERISGMPEFRIGEREIVFCKGNGQVISPIIGVWQGRFKVRSLAGQPVLLNHANKLIVGFSKDDVLISDFSLPDSLPTLAENAYKTLLDSTGFAGLRPDEFVKAIRLRLQSTR